MKSAPFREMRAFGRSLRSIGNIWDKYRERGISDVLSPYDDMTHPDWDKDGIHYQSVGSNAIEIVLGAMLATRRSNIDSVLDMPCGFGRVTRHLTAAFPDARLYACDLYRDRIDFCAREFRAIPIESNQDFAKVAFPEKFDLIWCGSLLTHLPESEFRSALSLFANSLAENGIAIVTTLGRASPFVQREVFPYLPADIYVASEIETTFARTGFGYADYGQAEKFFNQEKYGIAFISPSFVLRCLEDNPSIKVIGLSERGWDDQQDFVVIYKAPLNSPVIAELGLT